MSVGVRPVMPMGDALGWQQRKRGGVLSWWASLPPPLPLQEGRPVGGRSWVVLLVACVCD